MKVQGRGRLGTAVGCIVVGAAIGLSALAAGAQLPQRGPEVAVHSGRLTLRADGARLADVLEAVGRQANLRIVLRGVVDTAVTETFANIPLDDAIRRLTRWHAVVMIYEPSSSPTDHQSSEAAHDAVLTEVWVGTSSRNLASVERPSQARPSSPARIETISQGYRGSIDLTSALSAVRTQVRREAFDAVLHQHGEEAVAPALREVATEHADWLVRHAALAALASMKNSRAVDEVRSLVKELAATAIDDPDPRARRAAIGILASVNTPEAIDALRTASRDRHGVVRMDARRALARHLRAAPEETGRR